MAAIRSAARRAFAATMASSISARSRRGWRVMNAVAGAWERTMSAACRQ